MTEFENERLTELYSGFVYILWSFWRVVRGVPDDAARNQVFNRGYPDLPGNGMANFSDSAFGAA